MLLAKDFGYQLPSTKKAALLGGYLCGGLTEPADLTKGQILPAILSNSNQGEPGRTRPNTILTKGMTSKLIRRGETPGDFDVSYQPLLNKKVE